MVATALDQERQPLLGKRAPTPLPKLQLTIMCMLRMAEPILFQNIFAYINRMVEVLHIVDDPADVGWYSGLIESVFALAQLPMIYRWAQLSDRIGRRPCVLISTTCAATGALLFGLSNNLATALAARVVAGFMAGNISVVQSMVSEITDESNQARAFVIVDLVWYFGAIFGTLIGGCLSEPVTQLPWLFGSSRFLAAYPFFLPCFAAFLLAMSSVVMGIFFLEETLPPRRNVQLQSAVRATPRRSAWSLLRDPAIASILAPHFILSVQCIGFEVLFNLFSFTPISLGGLNRSSFEIGVALAFGGVVAVVSYPIVFPALSARMPVKVFYLYLMALYPFCCLVTPFLNTAARAFSVGGDTGGLTHEGKIVMWFLIGLLMLVARMGGMAFPAHSIFVRRAAPSQDSLGATFGLLHTVGATGRTLGPALVSMLFAVTVSHNLLGGWFVWLVMSLLGCVALFLASRVRDGSMEPRETKDSCSEVGS